MEQQLTIPLKEILELIHVAEDYGFVNPMLMASFAEWMDKKLDDKEIEEYASYFISDEGKEKGYDIEDYENAKEVLTEFKNRYCNT